MNAEQFINLVGNEVLNGWANSDLSHKAQSMLNEIALHYADCDECRSCFDEMGYEEDNLLDFFNNRMENTIYEAWVCDE